MTLHKNGFELIESPVKDYDFLDHQDVIGGYYQDCERIVGEATGRKFGRLIIIFDLLGVEREAPGQRWTGRARTGPHCSW